MQRAAARRAPSPRRHSAVTTGPSATPSSVALDVGGVAHDPRRGTTARALDVDEPARHEAAGHRLGDPEGEATDATSLAATACSIVSSSTPKTMSPKRSVEDRADGVLLGVEPSRPRLLGRRPHRHPHLQALDARGEERHACTSCPRARRVVAVERLGEPGLARSPRPQHPRGDDAGRPFGGETRAQVREDRALEHLLELVGHARDGVDDLAADRADEPRSGAAALLDHRRARRHVGLASVVVGHRPAPRGEHRLDARGDLVVADEVDAHHRRRSPRG